jgi:hypothetical protein
MDSGKTMLRYEVHHYQRSYKAYMRHGQWHRKDGPADISGAERMMWYQYDELHRIGGPAVIWEDIIEYHLRGTYVEE